MLTPIANVHRHKLPRAGAIVSLERLNLTYSTVRRWIVVGYPLSNSPDQRYSRGIHCVYVKPLGDRDGLAPFKMVAGHWCDELE